MPIVETKIVTRPNTSIPFFSQSDNTEYLASKAEIGTFTLITNTLSYQKSTFMDGSYIVERTYSEDLLTQTSKMTFDSLETWSKVDTCISIAVDKEYKHYAETNGFTHPSDGQYSTTGINSPFTCTTTYNYTSSVTEKYPLFESFINVIEASDKLTSFVNTGTQLIAVHTYADAVDFSENHWKDFVFTESLYNGEVTRTISYASVTTP